MDASKMTNEELANELLETVGIDSPFCQCDKCMAVREAAARLRNVTVRTDNSGVIAELQRRLNVAEDALEKCVKVQCSGDDDGISCEECDLACDGRCTQWMAKRALAAIREEGADNV